MFVSLWSNLTIIKVFLYCNQPALFYFSQSPHLMLQKNWVQLKITKAYVKSRHKTAVVGQFHSTPMTLMQ